MKQPVKVFSHPFTYLTREQRIVVRQNSAVPYLRMDDGICRSFLESGMSSTEFESVRLLFPFVREAALMQLPRHHHLLSDFLYFAFHAGNDFGERHPELLAEVLPDFELRQARRRLGVIKTLSEAELGTSRAIHNAFTRVVQGKYDDMTPGRLDAVYAELALRSLRCGYAVATLAHLDPQHCDFYRLMEPGRKKHCSSILWQMWLNAPADVVGLCLRDRLEHPLFRVARKLYDGRPTECAVVLRFIREHLSKSAASSENDCPASDADLIEWIGDGMIYGRRLQRNQPATLQRIFSEVGPDLLDDSVSVVHEVVAEVGSLEPALLLPPLKRWQKYVYGRGEPSFYGQSVERVALFADFACWIPWAMGFQPLQSKVWQDGQASLEA